MLFNSVHFLLFFAVVFLVYWLLPRRAQNPWLLLTSFFFYGYWDWRFLGLLIGSMLVDFTAGLLIGRFHERDNGWGAKLSLLMSLALNVGLLVSFKALGLLQSLLEHHDSANRFSATAYVIPLGISFYTFQALGYVIDVYRKRIRPTSNLVDFMIFVSFFPQLIAGPIEKAENLLPQVEGKRSIDLGRAMDSVFLFIWGLFFKTVAADNLLPFVVGYFEQPSEVGSLKTLLSFYAAAFHVYCDFAGYTYMALGVAGLLGFKLSDNFRMPYFSRGPQEFWNRWHITLVVWFRSYVFMPLSKLLSRRLSPSRSAAIALTATMLIFAMWHGPSLSFLIWGFVQAGVFFIYHWIHQAAKRRGWRAWPHWAQSLIWFHVLVLTSFIYRSRGLEDVGLHAMNLLRGGRFEGLDLALTMLFFVGPILVIEALHLKKGSEFFFRDRPWPFRATIALSLYAMVVTSGAPASWSFIYFFF